MSGWAVGTFTHCYHKKANAHIIDPPNHDKLIKQILRYMHVKNDTFKSGGPSNIQNIIKVTTYHPLTGRKASHIRLGQPPGELTITQQDTCWI